MTPQEASTALFDVLIAQEDSLTRKSLHTALEREGYRCAEVADGQQAVDLARLHPPQCVFVDLVLPGLDGPAVARRLRADPRTCGAHLYCFSASSGRDAQAQARQAGFETFLTKPVDMDLFLDVVHKQVKRTGPRWVFGLTLDAARELCDWLENNGYASIEVAHHEDGFAVCGARN